MRKIKFPPSNELLHDLTGFITTGKIPPVNEYLLEEVSIKWFISKMRVFRFNIQYFRDRQHLKEMMRTKLSRAELLSLRDKLEGRPGFPTYKFNKLMKKANGKKQNNK